ncbi:MULTISPECIES: outer membrane beta-barrel protein [Roseivirga]|nr:MULTISPECIES: outer membrane beta-barrel protein [Roseivirga]MEC7754991.1 outer membrane beta-barrel protein [Bacteroidota bacterium]
MKKLVMICLLMALGFSASAQFSLGPRVTLVNSKLTLKDAVANVEEGDAEFGYQFGIFMRAKVPVIGLYVQPEILFSKAESVLSVNNQDVSFEFNKIDVPIMIGGKVGPLRINAGPSLSFLTDASRSDVAGDIKDNYKDTSVGYQAGIGLDLLKFVFDVKYEGSLSQFGETIRVGNTTVNTDQRTSQWVFAVGFKLF